MSWNAYGSDHALVMHENAYGERYRVSISNADDFDETEREEIQNQADRYFDDRRTGDIPETGSYAGTRHMVDYMKCELSGETCVEVVVRRMSR